MRNLTQRKFMRQILSGRPSYVALEWAVSTGMAHRDGSLTEAGKITLGIVPKPARVVVPRADKSRKAPATETATAPSAGPKVPDGHGLGGVPPSSGDTRRGVEPDDGSQRRGWDAAGLRESRAPDGPRLALCGVYRGDGQGRASLGTPAPADYAGLRAENLKRMHKHMGNN